MKKKNREKKSITIIIELNKFNLLNKKINIKMHLITMNNNATNANGTTTVNNDVFKDLFKSRKFFKINAAV